MLPTVQGCIILLGAKKQAQGKAWWWHENVRYIAPRCLTAV